MFPLSFTVQFILGCSCILTQEVSTRGPPSRSTFQDSAAQKCDHCQVVTQTFLALKPCNVLFTLKIHGQNWLGSLPDNTETVKKNAVPKSPFFCYVYMCGCIYACGWADMGKPTSNMVYLLIFLSTLSLELVSHSLRHTLID